MENGLTNSPLLPPAKTKSFCSPIWLVRGETLVLLNFLHPFRLPTFIYLLLNSTALISKPDESTNRMDIYFEFFVDKMPFD